eukprot:1848078-Amphidinium_carterae.1
MRVQQTSPLHWGCSSLSSLSCLRLGSYAHVNGFLGTAGARLERESRGQGSTLTDIRQSGSSSSNCR